MKQPSSPQPGQLKALCMDLAGEIAAAFGLPDKGLAQRLAYTMLRKPIERFGKVWYTFNENISSLGLANAAKTLLSTFIDAYRIRGQATIPSSGPLLIVSNHPGAYDSITHVASVNRENLNVVATERPFFHRLEAVTSHMIDVPTDTAGRALTIRSSIRHLEAGGAVLIFAGTIVDPDPDVLPGADERLNSWSPSLDLIVRRVPDIQVVVTIISGILVPACAKHPLTRLARQDWEKRKAAEFIQILQQLVMGRKYGNVPRVSYAEPLAGKELLASGGRVADRLIARAHDVLNQHQTLPESAWQTINLT